VNGKHKPGAAPDAPDAPLPNTTPSSPSPPETLPPPAGQRRRPAKIFPLHPAETQQIRTTVHVTAAAAAATVVATVVATTWPASRRAEAEQYISGYLHIYLCFLFVS
jgi:hypothetical protein